MSMHKDVTGRDVRMWLLNGFRKVGSKIQPVTRPVTKAKIFVATSMLKARYAMKGQAAPITLLILAGMFDILISPVLYPFNWSMRYMKNLWYGIRPMKSLPTK